MAFNFKKRRSRINPSSEDIPAPDNTSCTPDSTQSASDNSKFRKSFSLRDSIQSSTESMANSARKVHQKIVDRNDFCGGYSSANHRWLKKYYKKFGGYSEYAITHIISDDGSVPIIQIANGEVKAYSIQDKDFLPGASQWLSDTNYDYTPPKEKAKSSKDDSAHSAQVKSKNSGIYFVVPNGYRISYRSSSNDDKTELNDGDNKSSGGR